MQELNGRAAVITGASRGIGAATARQLTAYGVNVVLAARSVGDLETVAGQIQEAGGRAEAVACDVTRYGDVARAVTRCRDAFGRLDILVNNAGVVEPIAHVATADPEAWGRTIDVNVKGVYHGLRAALPAMIAQGSGTIVNLSSGAATGVLEGWSAYCASKAAVLSLTRAAHLEAGDTGVRVVGLSPGAVDTGMQVTIKASRMNPVSRMDPADYVPPEWAARAIAWLCTAAAAEFAGTDFSIKTEDNRRRVGLA